MNKLKAKYNTNLIRDSSCKGVGHMNVITCNEKCRHQNQGYCGLNHITQLTGKADAEGDKCGYFEPFGDTQAKYRSYAYGAIGSTHKQDNERLPL